LDALKANDAAQLDHILGPDGKKILSSGDDVADKQARDVFLIAYAEKAELSTEGNRTILSVGAEEWPMPVPLVKEGNSWRFDTVAGLQEVLFRRIGNNELSTMQLCKAYVEAQKEYASKGHDGKAKGLYAQKFTSSTGKHDGLFWKSDDPNDKSPLGDLAAQAADDTGNRKANLTRHGYYFRILGAAHPHRGSTRLSGEWCNAKGFAMTPSRRYKNSGVMTRHRRSGNNLSAPGSDIARVAAEINAFDPTQAGNGRVRVMTTFSRRVPEERRWPAPNCRLPARPKAFEPSQAMSALAPSSPWRSGARRQTPGSWFSV
jgi:hypothetical protein